ncbi:hypothetical protein UFOVP235_46 [uncultured Caudovirales phage]|uniref:Uncharacterized protein n=1 Tax=uncultured Caudovirales phage TaxID=2100421 RepID=A0A6J7WRK1_9CAUD|nr:hypothetical protein UFOVP235_46 [uncultured Caudovirales phage]
MNKGIRAKGAVFEREVAAYFNDHLGLEARRTSVTTGFISGGNYDLSGLPDLAPECKRVERLDFRGAMSQAIRNARGTSMPVVITRRNREPLPDGLAVLRIGDFQKLYRAYLLQEGLLKQDDVHPPAT